MIMFIAFDNIYNGSISLSHCILLIYLILFIAGDFAITVDMKRTEISVGSMEKKLSDTVPIPLKGLTNPVSVDYDPVEKMVYWNDVETRPTATISRARLDGSHQATVVSGLVCELNYKFLYKLKERKTRLCL